MKTLFLLSSLVLSLLSIAYESMGFEGVVIGLIALAGSALVFGLAVLVCKGLDCLGLLVGGAWGRSVVNRLVCESQRDVLIQVCKNKRGE